MKSWHWSARRMLRLQPPVHNSTELYPQDEKICHVTHFGPAMDDKDEYIWHPVALQREWKKRTSDTRKISVVKAQ